MGGILKPIVGMVSFLFVLIRHAAILLIFALLGFLLVRSPSATEFADLLIFLQDDSVLFIVLVLALLGSAIQMNLRGASHQQSR